MSSTFQQKIIAICDFSERMPEVIVHAVRMADVLKKELCLTSFWKKKEERPQLQEKLFETSKKLKSTFPMLNISWLLLEKSLKDNIQKLIDEFEAVLCVLHQNDVKWVLPAFQQSSIAFLFVNGEVPRFLNYKSVLVPVDFRKASKDTSLWASYLGRFNKAQISLLYAHETEPERTEKLTRNVNFFRKFLSSLNISYRNEAGKSTSWGIYEEAIMRKDEYQSDILIISGSSNITLLDHILGLPEKKLLKKAGNLPVLMINPKKDICVLCD